MHRFDEDIWVSASWLQGVVVAGGLTICQSNNWPRSLPRDLPTSIGEASRISSHCGTARNHGIFGNVIEIHSEDELLNFVG